MKKIWGFKDPKTRKYGLLTLLFFALGFNLSMNPKMAEHFVRNELPEVFSTELAATSDEIVQATSREHEYILGTSDLGKGVNNVKIRLSEKDGKTKASIDSVTVAASADTCTDCLKKLTSQSFNYSLALTKDNLEAIKKLVEADVVKAAKDAKVEVKKDDKKDEKVADKKDVKEGEFEEADIAEWAKNCSKKSEDDDLDCHKDNLAKLSKHLKNHSKQASIVKKYFDKYMKSELTKGLRKDTLSEEYKEAYLAMGEIVEELESKNGKSTVQQIYKIAAKGVEDRTRAAERLRLEGFNEGNPLKFQEGLRQLSMLEPSFYSTASMLTGATSSMIDLSDKDLSGYQSMFQTNYSTPVRSFLTQLARGCSQTSLNATATFNGCSVPTISIGDSDASDVVVSSPVNRNLLNRSALLNRTGRTAISPTARVGSRTYVDPRYNRTTTTQRYNSLGQPIVNGRRSTLPFQNGSATRGSSVIGGSPCQRDGTCW